MAIEETRKLLKEHCEGKRWVSIIRTVDGSYIASGHLSKLQEISDREIIYIEFSEFLDGPNKERKFFISKERTSVEIPYNLSIYVQPISQKKLEQLLHGDDFKIGF